jgi:hypothetical protein
MGGPIAIGALVVLLGLVAYKLLGGATGDAKFVVRVGADATVTVRGDVPGLSEGAVIEFVAGLQLPAGAKFWGVRDGDRIALRFSGDIPDNLQQRTRNFFYNAT